MATASPLPPTRISREDYLRMERLAQFKSEYHAGYIVALSGASRFHVRIAANLMFALSSQLRGGPCRNYSNDMRVSVRGGQSYFYPDIIVTCGKEEYEDDKFDTLLNPIVVIEILSDSTEAHDRGFKFLAYQSIPSLQEYVLITQSPRRFEIFRRQEGGAWLYQSWAFSPPPLVLQSIGCTLSADDVYFKVEDDGTPQEPIDDETRAV